MSAGQQLLQTVSQPHSLEAEQSVLGALLIDNSAWDRVADLLHGADFHRVEHRLVFAVIGKLITAGKPADVITVNEECLRQAKADSFGGLEYLNALAMSVPSSTNARRYAELVREMAQRRELLRLAATLADGALARDTSLETTVDRNAQALLAIGQSSSAQREPLSADVVLVRFMDQLNAAAEGSNPATPTGLRELDLRTAGGGRSGELWVVGARPSMGKSAFMLTVGLHVAGAGEGVLFNSQEDPDTTMMSRAIAHLGRLNLADLRNPQRCQDPDRMWQGVTLAADEMQRLPLLIDDQGGLSLSDVRRKVQQARRKLGGRLKLVVVDYLQLMAGDGDNRNQMLGAIANGMKSLAKEFGVWIVLLSQLNRKADERTGVPQLSDLRDSGDIEGAADVILLLHREAMRNQKLGDDWKPYAQIHIAKQKNGPVSIMPARFDGAHQRFSDWDGPPPMSRAGRGSDAGGGLE
jgi:replicative DNA helicase